MSEAEERAFPLCVYCGLPAPDINLHGESLLFVLERNQAQGDRLARGETMLWANCSEEEARLFNDHISACAYAWPLPEEDHEVLQLIDLAFATAPRPDQFTDHRPCFECSEIDERLQGFVRTSLQGTLHWDGLYLWNAEAGAYFMPALARFALRPTTCYGGLANLLLNRLFSNSAAWLGSFTPEQRAACKALMNRALEKELFNYDEPNVAERIAQIAP